MNRIRTVILIVIAYCLACCAQSAQISPDKQKQLETAVSRFMAARSIPGISVAVVENGAYEWSAGFGMADLENSVPATSQTLYRLASVSKPITATAALLLWQQGKLDLDAPVQRYCPGFPQKEAPITTRQVLGHLGGIRFYKSMTQDDPEYGNTRHFDHPIQGGLDFFKDELLVARPGVEYHYSTQGYTVAGCVIEGASKQSYVGYVRENILTRAGMTHTVADDRFAIIPFRTRFYSKDKSGSIRNSDFLDASYKIPGGGWLSSVDDMAKFEVAMLNDQLVQRSTRDLMWTSLKSADGKETGYGLGWGIGKDLGTPDVGHIGGQQGTSTSIIMTPERRAGVVVLMNFNDGDVATLAVQLMKIVLGSSKTGP